MTPEDLVGKQCVIALSYFDVHGEPLSTRVLAGTVVSPDDDGLIAVDLSEGDQQASSPVLHLPESLAPWFRAPPGHYRDQNGAVIAENPDYLVTWDIHRQRKGAEDGQHEWWEWVPRTARPSVGA